MRPLACVAAHLCARAREPPPTPAPSGRPAGRRPLCPCASQRASQRAGDMNDLLLARPSDARAGPRATDRKWQSSARSPIGRPMERTTTCIRCDARFRPPPPSRFRWRARAAAAASAPKAHRKCHLARPGEDKHLFCGRGACYLSLSASRTRRVRAIAAAAAAASLRCALSAACKSCARTTRTTRTTRVYDPPERRQLAPFAAAAAAAAASAPQFVCAAICVRRTRRPQPNE